MPKISGVFEKFDNLDQISLENVVSSLKFAITLINLQNQRANLIYYPQTIPIEKKDLTIALAILKEAIAGGPYFSPVSRKIFIPYDFVYQFSNLVDLAVVFIDALLTKPTERTGIWSLILKSDLEQVAGTVVFPKLNQNSSVEFGLEGKKYMVKAGSVVSLPCNKQRCQLSYKLTNGSLLNQASGAVEVYGGPLGVLIDGRKK